MPNRPPAVTVPPAPNLQPVVSLAVAAATLGVSELTVRRFIASGRLPAYRVGGSIRVRASDLASVMRPWSDPTGTA